MELVPPVAVTANPMKEMVTLVKIVATTMIDIGKKNKF
jgi:hypothetical protein